ncbi:MAG: hypothetical protein ACI3ZS_00610 [Candidatus Cryptobacteroides sp.]
MKKILVSIVSVLALYGMSSCQKTEEISTNEIKGSTFSICANVEQTKTTIDGLKVDWEEGDILYLVTSDGTWGKSYSEDKGTESIAEYKYTEGIFTSSATIKDGSYNFYALYSNGAGKSYHRCDATSFSLASTQNQDCLNPTAHLKINDALAGSFSASVPRTKAANVNMSHLFTIMRVDVKNNTGEEVDVKKFEMSAADATLSGIFTVNFTNSPIDITYKSGSSNSITVNITNGTIAADESLPVYFVMAPLASYSGDVTFTVTDAKDLIYTKTVHLTDITFEAGCLNTTPYTITKSVAPTTYNWNLSVNSTSTATADEISWTNSVADMVCAKGESSSDANYYYPGTSGHNYTSTRFPAKSVLTITPKSGNVLTYYVFNATSANYASALANSVWTNVADMEVEGTTVTIVAKEQGNPVSANISAVCGFTKVECHTDEAPVFPPVISVTTTSVNVSAEGGSNEISYFIKHAVDGKSISAVSNQDWVNTFDYSTDGKILFNVAKNEGEARTATVTLKYDGATDVNVTVNQTVAGGEIKTWNLVTDASTLAAGDKLIIVSTSKGCAAGNISSSVMSKVSVSITDNKISSLPSEVVMLTLGGSSGSWTLSNSEGKLLGATAVKKLAWDSGTTTWSISIDKNSATIQNKTSTYGRFMYNVSNPRFATYTSDVSATMLLPEIYRYE